MIRAQLAWEGWRKDVPAVRRVVPPRRAHAFHAPSARLSPEPLCSKGCQGTELLWEGALCRQEETGKRGRVHQCSGREPVHHCHKPGGGGRVPRNRQAHSQCQEPWSASSKQSQGYTPQEAGLPPQSTPLKLANVLSTADSKTESPVWVYR